EFKVTVTCYGNAMPGAALNLTSDLPTSSLSPTGVTDSNGSYIFSGTLSTSESTGTHTLTVNATPNIGCDPGTATANLQVTQLAFTDVLSSTLTNLFSGTVSVASLLLVGVIVAIIVAVIVFSRKKWRLHLEPKRDE